MAPLKKFLYLMWPLWIAFLCVTQSGQVDFVMWITLVTWIKSVRYCHIYIYNFRLLEKMFSVGVCKGIQWVSGDCSYSKSTESTSKSMWISGLSFFLQCEPTGFFACFFISQVKIVSLITYKSARQSTRYPLSKLCSTRNAQKFNTWGWRIFF